jgi:hypothetical protein
MIRLLACVIATTSGAPPDPPFDIRIEHLGASLSNPVESPKPKFGSLPTCGEVTEWSDSGSSVPGPPLRLKCPGGTINRIVFASFGNPTGSCIAGGSSFQLGSCHSPRSIEVVEKLCLNRGSCELPSSDAIDHFNVSAHKPSPMASLFLPDPCVGKPKKLAATVQCTTPASSGPPPFPLPSAVLGLDVFKPRFSWKLWYPERGQFQRSYRLVVTSESKVVWDSGHTISSQSTLVAYAGPPLLPLGSYSWSVQWTDMAGATSNFSASQRFDMAPTASTWNSARCVTYLE